MLAREIELINDIRSNNEQQQHLVGTLYRDILINKTTDLKIELYRLTGRAYRDYTSEEKKNAQVDGILV